MAFKTIRDFEGVRRSPKPAERVDNIKQAAEGFRKRMLEGKPLRYYRSMELVRVPYPSRYGYLHAFTGLSAMLHLVNRLFVVQTDTPDGLKTILLSPSDWENQVSVPFFQRLSENSGRIGRLLEPLVFARRRTVPQALAEIGLAPEDIDYISYDHLHTQYLRRWLGTDDQPGLFPKAKLLVMRTEWEAAQALLPWDRQWYCPDGLSGIPESRLELLDGDVMVGEGLALVRTPGHTAGNHSFVAHTDAGLLVTSENGISLDAYSPERSRIPGLAAFAKATGAEVVLNGNTLEDSSDQYLSMIQEKAIAGPHPTLDGIANLAPSSESDGFWMFPKTAPTYRRGDAEYGQLQRPIGAAA
jgi:hypothetical protein